VATGRSNGGRESGAGVPGCGGANRRYALLSLASIQRSPTSGGVAPGCVGSLVGAPTYESSGGWMRAQMRDRAGTEGG
jgi:hypothetical protein